MTSATRNYFPSRCSEVEAAFARIIPIGELFILIIPTPRHECTTSVHKKTRGGAYTGDLNYTSLLLASIWKERRRQSHYWFVQSHRVCFAGVSHCRHISTWISATTRAAPTSTGSGRREERGNASSTTTSRGSRWSSWSTYLGSVCVCVLFVF